MLKAKDLIGKALIHQATGQQIATVHDVLLDNAGTAILAVLVGGGWLSATRVVPWESVVKFSDVLLVDGADPIIDARSDPQIAAELKQSHPLTGTTLLSESGEQIATVGDLLINERGQVVGYQVRQGFINDLAGRKFLPIAYVQAIGKDAVIAKDTDLVSMKSLEQSVRDSEGDAVV